MLRQLGRSSVSRIATASRHSAQRQWRHARLILASKLTMLWERRVFLTDRPVI